MIRNIKLKRALTDFIFPIFSILNKIIPKNEHKVLIYCAGNRLSDNSKYIFDYLLNNGYNEKYEIVVNSKINVYPEKNVRIVNHISSIFQYMRSGHVFYHAGKLPIKPTRDQNVINMWHGVPLKRIGLMSRVSSGRENFFTWVCAPSELFRPIMAKAFGCSEKRVFICGEAKVDALFAPLRQKNYKLIVWAPTFRRSESLGYNDSSIVDLLPIFRNDEWEELNNFLEGRKIKIIVKLHTAQDLNGFYKKEYMNLIIYSDLAFRDEKLDLWDLLAQSNGLISDYSSVFINYLVLNRPICFAIPDIDDYSDTRGFVFENPLDYMPGIHARTKKDIYRFVEQLEKNEDKYEEERRKVGELMNKFHDGKNCERIVKQSGLSK